MPKIGLVLGSGGAKGAFEVGAAGYAMEVKGYAWDVIAGVSVGALNGAMIAQGRYGRLRELWSTISNDRVFIGKRKWRAVAKLLMGGQALYDPAPLSRIIEEEVDPSKIAVDLKIGAVSLITGDYHLFTPSFPHFKKAILASMALPLAFPPVDVSPEYPCMVDGALRNVTPLSAVLATEPDEIVVINCHPFTPTRLPARPTSMIGVAARVVELAMNANLRDDLEKVRRINSVVEHSAKIGSIPPCNSKGRPFRYVKCTVIEPDFLLGDALQFSPDLAKRAMKHGWEKAEQAFNAAP